MKKITAVPDGMLDFRKKPVVIQAIQITETSEVDTLEGTMRGSVGDFLIRGVKGELYFCKPDIFKSTYEPVEKQ
jgi:response regulator of citrate/malate metabolism